MRRWKIPAPIFADTSRDCLARSSRNIRKTFSFMPPLQTVSLLGIPYDGNSSYLQGPALAPPLIRKALNSDSTNMWTEDGIDLGQPGTFHDAGDLNLPAESLAAFANIEKAVAEALGLGHPLISLGGDHSITYPLCVDTVANFLISPYFTSTLIPISMTN